jgi:hypothetical protein
MGRHVVCATPTAYLTPHTLNDYAPNRSTRYEPERKVNG